MNALVSINFFDVGHSVIGRGQAYPIGANGEARSSKIQTCARVFNTGFICSSLDNTRSNGAPLSNDGVAG